MCADICVHMCVHMCVHVCRQMYRHVCTHMHRSIYRQYPTSLGYQTQPFDFSTNSTSSSPPCCLPGILASSRVVYHEIFDIVVRDRCFFFAELNFFPRAARLAGGATRRASCGPRPIDAFSLRACRRRTPRGYGGIRGGIRGG